jgi:hypothetical protein
VPWRKDRTCLLPDGSVQQRFLDIPQSHLIREYCRAANSVDIHNQYRQGILAIEKPWRTRSWTLRLFQTVIGKMLVNALFAFRFETGRTLSITDFTNTVAQALCGVGDAEEAEHERGRTRATPTTSSLRNAVAQSAGRLSHALVKGTSIGMGNGRHQGPCRLCKNKHATGVCVRCSNRMNTEDPDLFWICSPGFHGRQCNCQHLHDMLGGPR